MGLRVLLLGKRSVYDSFKTSVVSQAINIGKAYNLLHKQMWNKDKAVARGDFLVQYPHAFKRISMYTNPHFSHFNGRPVGFIRLWNIKSESKQAYSPTDPYALGLNQLFKGQDPYKEYEGDPGSGDGIYHDDCYIHPKEIRLDSGMSDVWVYWVTAERYDVSDQLESYVHYKYTFSKLSTLGVQVIDNVELVHYDKTVTRIVNGVPTSTVVHCRKLKISPTGKTDVYYDLGAYGNAVNIGPVRQVVPDSTCDGVLYGPSANYSNGREFPIQAWTIWPTDAEMEAQYGKCVYTENHDSRSYVSPLLLYRTSVGPEGVLSVVDADGNVVSDVTVQQVSAHHAIGWKTKIYANGFAIEYVPYSCESASDGEYPAHFKVLPMVYLDTGDLAMPRQIFVNRWDDYFDLYVHEKNSGGLLVKLAMVIVIVVITYISAGSLTAPTATLFTALAWVGAALSIVGVLTGEKSMMLLGSIVGGIGAIYSTITKTITSGLTSEIIANSAPTMTAGRAADLATSQVAKMTFSEMFSSFISVAGLTNMFSIGAQTISTVMNIGAILSPESMTTPKEVPVEDEVGMQLRLDFKEYKSEEDEVMTLADPARLLR